MTCADLSLAASNAVPKGYKQTEVGVIPEDWDVRRLRDVADANWGNTSITKDAYQDSGFQAYSASGPDGFVDWFEHDSPAVVLSAIGAQCGKTWLAIGKWTPIKNTIWFRAIGGKAETNFLYRVTGDPSFWPNRGQAQPFIALGDVRDALVPLPPCKAEQEAIAKALSDADALIGSLQQLIAKKRQIKQGAMQALLTGQQRLPGFSDAWPVRRLGDLFEFSGGFTASRDQLGTEGHCYLHYGDIHTSSKSFVDVRAEHQNIPKLDVSLKRVSPGSLLKEGDVVFVDASEDDEGASKHVVILNTDGQPFISGLHTIVAKAKADELAHDYLRHCFHTTKIKSQFLFFAVGTKVSGISKTNIAKITMRVPSVTEQTSIATILSDMDAEIAALETRLSKAHEIKRGMMQALLTGAIRLPLAEAA